MKHELIGVRNGLRVVFESPTEAIHCDYKLFKATGDSYNFYYNNKLIPRLKIDETASIEDEIDYITYEIGYMDSFARSSYEVIKTWQHRRSHGECDCGSKSYKKYEVYDLFDDNVTKRWLCFKCAKQLAADKFELKEIKVCGTQK